MHRLNVDICTLSGVQISASALCSANMMGIKGVVTLRQLHNSSQLLNTEQFEFKLHNSSQLLVPEQFELKLHAFILQLYCDALMRLISQSQSSFIVNYFAC